MQQDAAAGFLKRMKPTALIISLLVSLSCTDFGRPVDRIRQESPIRETVYRELLNRYAHGNLCFLAISATNDSTKDLQYWDPASDIFDQLKVDSTKVRPVTECLHSTDGVFDRETLKRGIILWTSSITWVSGDDVKVSAGYFADGENGLLGWFELTWKAGRWAVNTWHTTAVY